MFKDGVDLTKYVNSTILSVFDNDFQEIQNNSKLIKSDLQVQYTASLIKGTITKNGVFEYWNQYLLDIDAFKELEESANYNIDKAYLNSMNSLIFDTYKKSLGESFIEELSNENFKDECVIGVTKNV